MLGTEILNEHLDHFHWDHRPKNLATINEKLSQCHGFPNYDYPEDLLMLQYLFLLLLAKH